MSTATLNDIRATHARLSIPAWGISWAEVSLDGEHTLEGAATLKIADLSLACTVVSGGPAKGRSYYRVAGGAGGWGKTIPAKGYADDAGVKVASILQDAANEAGEMLDATTLPTTRLGPAYERDAGPASRALALLSPEQWYVGEDGRTRIGRRPAADLSVKAALGVIDRARGVVPLAAESIATILPGVRVEGLEALDVLHEVTPRGLRSTLWTTLRTDALRRLFDALYPENRYRGVFEYRVVSQEGERLNLQPVRVSLGMPDVRRAIVRPGIPGCRADVEMASRVLVAFVDQDPSRPVVVAFEDAEGDSFVPDRLDLADAGGRVLRDGERVTVFGPATLANGIADGIITIHTAVVSEGDPPLGFSRVRA